jgi:hypothetical protein
MDECDVCGKPAEHTCGKCFQAVYCSVDCQMKDHEEHAELECYEPHEMTPEQLRFEIQMEMMDNDETPHIGANLGHEDLIGVLNRYRTKRKVRKNRRSLRSERRKKRRANRGTRVAKKGIRQQKVLDKTAAQRRMAEARERQAQRQFGTRN